MATNRRRLDYFLLFLKNRRWKLLLFGREILVISDFVTFFILGAEGAQQEADSETKEFRNLKARITLGLKKEEEEEEEKSVLCVCLHLSKCL